MDFRGRTFPPPARRPALSSTASEMCRAESMASHLNVLTYIVEAGLWAGLE